MNKSIKKIIAREGLILSGIIAIGVILIWISVPTGQHLHYVAKVGLKDLRLLFDNRFLAILYAIGIRILYFGYPIYLFIRFIIWAIKTLREK